MTPDAPGRGGRHSQRYRDDDPQDVILVDLPAAASRAAADITWESEELADLLPEALPLEDPVLAAVLPALDRAARTGADERYTKSAAAFLAVHLLTTHRAAHGPTRAAPSYRRMHEVEDHMREHLAEPLTLSDLAAVAHLSQYHFARTFREAVGVPPRQRLTELRLEHALGLLRRGDLGVAQVAAASGFPSTARLTAAVRRAYGTTPTAIRTGSSPRRTASPRT